MPKIPTIGIGSTQLARPRLTTTTPSSEERATGIGKGIESIGNAINTVGEEAYRKLDEARNYVEGSQFDIIQAKKAEIVNKYARMTTTDENGRVWSGTDTPENRAALAADLAKIDEESFAVFSNKMQLARAKGIAGKSTVATTIDVQGNWMKNIARNGEASTSIYYEGIINDTKKDMDEKEKLFNERANADITKNISTPEVAYNRSKAALSAAKMVRFQESVRTDPYETIKNIDKLNLNQEEKDKAVRYYNQVINQIQKGNEDEYNKQIIAGTDIGDLKELVKKDVAAGRVSSEYGLGFIKKKEEKPLTEFEKVVKATELQERAAKMQAKIKSIFARPDFKLLAQYRADVIKSAADGYITDSEMKTLLAPTSERWVAFKTFDGAINVLKANSQLYQSDSAQAYAKSQMYGELYKRIGNGEDPNQAAADIIKQRTLDEASRLQSTVNETGKIVVIRKSDKQRVRIPADKFDAKRYERVK